MRIAQVVTYISADAPSGGPAAVALVQSFELAREGHEVHLYAAWDGETRVAVDGVRLHLFRVPRPRFGVGPIVSLRLVAALRRRRDRFDAIHLHLGRDLGSIVAWMSIRDSRGHRVLQPHGLVMPDADPRARVVDAVITRRALRSASSVLALTGREERGLRSVARGPIVVERLSTASPMSVESLIEGRDARDPDGGRIAGGRPDRSAMVDQLVEVYSRRAASEVRVAITQPYVPEYRIALWEAVVALLAERGVDARVFWGGSRSTVGAFAARGDLTRPPWSERVPALEVRWSRKHPPLLLRRLPRPWRRPTLLVTEMQATNVNAWAAVACRTSFITMGHGTSAITTDSQFSAVLESTQNRLARRVLAYTPAGRAAVLRLTGLHGSRVISFDNATDTEGLRAALRRVRPGDIAGFRTSHGIAPGARIALYIGALEEYKRVALLEEAAKQVLTGSDEWHLVVAGDGSERGRLESLAASTGRVTLLGRVPPRGFAPAALDAAVLLNPGRIGLVAVDALTIGLPILTTEGAVHAPEYSYLEVGRDVVAAEDSAVAFARLWTAVGSRADRTAPAERLSAGRSAEIITETILAALREPRRRRRAAGRRS